MVMMEGKGKENERVSLIKMGKKSLICWEGRGASCSATALNECPFKGPGERSGGLLEEGADT